MQILVESLNIDIIKQLKSINFIDGINIDSSDYTTTNNEQIHNIIHSLNLPIHLPISESIEQDIITKAKALNKISNNIILKLPTTEETLKACVKLQELNIQTNLLCSSIHQALLCSKAGSNYISLAIKSVGKVDSSNTRLIRQCCEIWQNYPEIYSELIVTSISKPIELIEVSKLGVDFVSIPPYIVNLMLNNN